MIDLSDDLINRLNTLKKNTFFEILELARRVFIIVDYDEGVVIGKRGFLPEEKERGLVLVFNNSMKFNWDNDAIKATLVFGNTPEKCYIPVNAIAGVFSPDLKVQLTVPVFKLLKKKEKIKDSSASSHSAREKMSQSDSVKKLQTEKDKIYQMEKEPQDVKQKKTKEKNQREDYGDVIDITKIRKKK